MSNNKSNIFVSTVVLEGDKVLMMREAKNNLGQRGTWNFPAGHAEHGEGLADAAVREVLEETGYEVKLTGVAAMQKRDSADGSMKFVVFFTGERTKKSQNTPGDETEKVEFIPISKMSSLPMRFPELITIAQKVADGQVAALDILAFENIATADAPEEPISNTTPLVAKDSLKFSPKLTELIKKGEKTSTFRLDKKNLAVGDIAEFITRYDTDTTEHFGYGRITDVKAIVLKDLPLDYFGNESYSSKDEQLKVQKKYYGDEVTMESEFTVYDFEYLGVERIAP